MNNDSITHTHRQHALANSLRFLRFKYNIKRQWLADEVGLSLAAYEKLEQGKTQAHFTDIIAICEALGAPMDELMQHYQRELNKVGGVIL